MNYKLIYDQLIEHAKLRNLKKLAVDDLSYQYIEIHHIIPRSFGGGDEQINLVNLTAREHFVAHLLLLKIAELEHGKTSSEYAAMLTAINLMSSENKGNIKISSRIYALIRSQFSKLQSIRMSGKNNPMYGHACTEFMSQDAIRKWHENHKGKNHQFYGKTRKDHSEKMSGFSNPMFGRSVKEFMSKTEIAEWKKHLSESHKGEHNGFFGKHHTEETKNKIKARLKASIAANNGHGYTYGKKISAEASRHLSEIRRGKKKTKAQLLIFNKTRIKNRFAERYDLSEFDFELYITLSAAKKEKYRKTYLKTHLKND